MVFIPKLISEDQAGRISSRNIATVIRTIDGVINYLSRTGKVGYILAVDFRKAFDSISKEFFTVCFQSIWVWCILSK